MLPAKGDVVTALLQPHSFTVLVAAGCNDEIRYEALGVKLSEALVRTGGLQDGQRKPHRPLLELFGMLHHVLGLLLRALNAQVTGTKPLQVQPGQGQSGGQAGNLAMF